jgi:hypothetical protein
LQPAQAFSDGCATQAVLRRKIGLSQMGPAGKFARDDLLPQHQVGAVGRSLTLWLHVSSVARRTPYSAIHLPSEVEGISFPGWERISSQMMFAISSREPPRV